LRKVSIAWVLLLLSRLIVPKRSRKTTVFFGLGVAVVRLLGFLEQILHDLDAFVVRPCAWYTAAML